MDGKRTEIMASLDRIRDDEHTPHGEIAIANALVRIGDTLEEILDLLLAKEDDE